MACRASEYLTIAAPSRANVREKMSRFLAFAAPASTPEEARAFVAAKANEYHDARHCCWAYSIGADGSVTASNDNGEPSGTAGKPILGQIRSHGLTNVVVAVVRYFGGIKLGTSGLIAAYRAAACEALDAALTVTAHEMASLTVTFPYIAMNDVMRALKNSEATITGQEFDNTCSITISIRADRAEAMKTLLEGVDGTSVSDPVNLF